MRYITFTPETNQYPVALLTRYLREKELQVHVKGFEDQAVAYATSFGAKPKKVDLEQYVEELFPTLCKLQVDYLIVTDGALFKYLTKVVRVDSAVGYVLPCVLKDYEHMHVVYMPSPQQLIYNPELFSKLEQSRDALVAHRQGTYQEPGTGVARFKEFPHTLEKIRYWLRKLVDKPLAMDIEAYSLKFWDAGIATICLCWSQEEGIAFEVDQGPVGEEVRKLLREFFEHRNAPTLWHNGTYDLTVLIYQLFMDGFRDTEGLLHGLDVMTRNWHDTKIITYLATNSCAGNTLGLKDLAQEYLGNWAVDVQDVRQHTTMDLLNYNVHDGLGTWYVYNKYYPRMVADQQLGIYQNLFLPMARDIIQMQLTGLPLNMEAVLEGEREMQAIWNKARDTVLSSQPVAQADWLMGERWALKRNSVLKKKRVTPADYPEQFNLNSPVQLQTLLFEIMELPVLSRTKTGQPETGGDALKALKNHTQDPQYLEVLDALIEFKEVDKILNTFVAAFKQAPQAEDGWHYLYGFFNIGGTVSGRLSSNGPNLQNLPSSGTRYAKIIKRMFQAPPGWLFVGLDFSSLEDRISALTTKDPNKLKVYVDGYDGHCLRAYSYFGNQMPDIDPGSVESINSIESKYKALRQLSKGPTFLLTYGGTYHGLISKFGFTEAEAIEIESRYHDLYSVSDQWVQDRLDQAASDGYVTVAFGLRVRTPLLHQTIARNRATPAEAAAEGRTAGNAMGQSYGLLNSRAGMETMNRVRNHPKYRTMALPCAQIHDAQYYLIRNDVELLAWLNQVVVEEAEWQELPEIQHPQVKLGGELSVFYPTWNDEFSIPNGADIDQIISLSKDHHERTNH